MIAFDADVIIYTGIPEHPQGKNLMHFFSGQKTKAGVGSVLLYPEILSKPFRDSALTEAVFLRGILNRLDLLPCTKQIALLATIISAKYSLKAADAIHLATAIQASADAFVTNNRKDFKKTITEIPVLYPEELSIN